MKDEISARLVRRFGRNDRVRGGSPSKRHRVLTADEIEGRLAAVDIDSLRAVCSERVRVEVWDRVSAIGELSAVDVVDAYPGMQAAFSVFVDGERVVFQPFHPDEEGNVPMEAVQAGKVAERQRARLVEAMVDNEIARRMTDDG